jgi:hypothetical protein
MRSLAAHLGQYVERIMIGPGGAKSENFTVPALAVRTLPAATSRS